MTNENIKETKHQRNKKEGYINKLQNELDNNNSLLRNKEYTFSTYNDKIGKQSVLTSINDIIDKNLKMNLVIKNEEEYLDNQLYRYNNISKIYKEKAEKENQIWEREIDRIQKKNTQLKTNTFENIVKLNNEENNMNEKLTEQKKNINLLETELATFKQDNYNSRKNKLEELNKERTFKKEKNKKIKEYEVHINYNINEIAKLNKEINDIPDIKRQKNHNYYKILNDIEKTKNELYILESDINTHLDLVNNKEDEVNYIEDDNNDECDDDKNKIKELWNNKYNLETSLKELYSNPDYDITKQYKILDEQIINNGLKIKVCEEQIEQLNIIKRIEEDKKYVSNYKDINEDIVCELNKKIKQLKKVINDINLNLECIIKEKELNYKINNENENILSTQYKKANERLQIMTKRFSENEKKEGYDLHQEIIYIRAKINDIKETKRLNDILVKEQYKKFNDIIKNKDIDPKIYFSLKNDIDVLKNKINTLSNELKSLRSS